ncbi:MAG: hypothetical protein ABH859_01540 [Pseudomonadota bacterium]
MSDLDPISRMNETAYMHAAFWGAIQELGAALARVREEPETTLVEFRQETANQSPAQSLARLERGKSQQIREALRTGVVITAARHPYYISAAQATVETLNMSNNLRVVATNTRIAGLDAWLAGRNLEVLLASHPQSIFGNIGTMISRVGDNALNIAGSVERVGYFARNATMVFEQQGVNGLPRIGGILAQANSEIPLVGMCASNASREIAAAVEAAPNFANHSVEVNRALQAAHDAANQANRAALAARNGRTAIETLRESLENPVTRNGAAVFVKLPRVMRVLPWVSIFLFALGNITMADDCGIATPADQISEPFNPLSWAI